MSREPVAWVLNLDAEDELRHGGLHTPSKATLERASQLSSRLDGLIQPGDEILWPGHPTPGRAREGRPWCPTPWALRQIDRAGLRVPEAPPAEILRRVNHRAFAHGLGQALPHAVFVRTQPELEERLARQANLAEVSLEKSWLLKLPLGYAGRGRRKVRFGLDKADRVWIEAALRDGDGLQVEPFVTREGDFALHGWVSQSKRVTLGRVTVQRIDRAGTWLASDLAGAGDLEVGERDLLEATAADTGAALAIAGYFGPFGVDAFRWRAPGGELRFQPRSEVNARYSMAWGLGATAPGHSACNGPSRCSPKAEQGEPGT